MIGLHLFQTLNVKIIYEGKHVQIGSSDANAFPSRACVWNACTVRKNSFRGFQLPIYSEYKIELFNF